MKDIDFDELDRAVSSLMGSASLDSLKTDKAEPSEKVLEINSSKNASSVTVASTAPIQPERKVAQSTLQSASPAQRRSGGRFMDVMHPSATTRSRPVQPPARVGITIAPPRDISSESEAASVKENPVDAEPQVEAEQVNVQSDALARAETAAPLIVSPPPQLETTAESPFLSHAKVEKRPLNAGSSVEEVPEEVAPTQTDAEIKPYVPAELEHDLVEIEAHEPDALLASGAEDSPADAIENVGVVDRPLGDPRNVSDGPSSIVQQYREQPSTGDQSHAAIYDASQYTEPAHHQATGQSNWLWILWVLLLLAIGAGGAYALYTLGII